MESTNFKVDISKEFSVSVKKLFNAWTNGEELKKWWKPMNKNLVEVVNDLKEGGLVKYTFEDNILLIEGKYIEVKDKEKLVYTWNWHLPKDDIKDSSYQLTVEFTTAGNGSTIHVLQENFENEEGTLPHKEGWQTGLDDLAKYLRSENN